MKVRPVITGLLAGLLFGLATPLSKILLSEMNSFALAGLLYFGAAIAFLPFIISHGKAETIAVQMTGKKLQLGGVVLFGGILGPVFLMIGLKTANASSVSIWLNMEMVATAILGILFFKDHLDRYTIIGIVLTLVAGILISTQEPGSGLLSGLFILIACIFWGLDNQLSAVIDGVSPQMITFIKGVIGGFTNLVIGIFIGGTHLQVNVVAISLVIGIFSYGLSIVLYVNSAQNLGATRSQMLFSSSPFWGIAGAWIFLGEMISIKIIVSILLLIAGILFINFALHIHRHFHKNMVHIHIHGHDDGHHDHFHEGMADKSLKHSHLHEHESKLHSHKHFPDLHHRHEH